MLKSDHSSECKFVLGHLHYHLESRSNLESKRTNICLTCARLKNCCQCCMLDLSFGLPIMVRDAALKMVAPGPQSEVNREYYAQNNEREIEEGRADWKLTRRRMRRPGALTRLANSEPYYKKQRRLESEGGQGGQEGQKKLEYGPGPIRTKDSRGSPATRGQRGGEAEEAPCSGAAQPITPQIFSRLQIPTSPLYLSLVSKTIYLNTLCEPSLLRSAPFDR